MDITGNSALLLKGVRIVDWTVVQTGPSATQLLADMGAEVIKVESRAGGDLSRGVTKDAGNFLMLSNGLSYGFENNNRNKKSIAVDLTKEEGRKIIYSLVAKADVFVQNFRNGVAKKLKVDYETLQKYNGSLVYANCTGYGPKGSQASKPAMDSAIHAASGMMLGIGDANMPPVHLPGAMSDKVTGLMLAYAIMLGLFYRERTGTGQSIDVSMLGSMIWLQGNNLLYSLLFKKSRERQLRTKPKNPLVNHYCCKDGRWILFAMFQPDKYWSAFCRALGIKNLINDPRFSNLNSRERHCTELVSILDKEFAKKTRAEWLDILAKEDLIYSAIKDYWEVLNDPQVLENDYITEFDHPTIGKLKEIGLPVKFSKTPGSIREPAPQLGQHTEEVLIDILDLSWEEIEKLRDREVIL
ncbi:CaiB/BaiF CoA transferase family protein [Thermodesulfobacteriota bacterium]